MACCSPAHRCTAAFNGWSSRPCASGRWVAACLIGAGHAVALVTYGVTAVMWALFLAREWLMPYRCEWNTPAGDIRNHVTSALVAYDLLPALLKPLFYTALEGGWATGLSPFSGT